MARIPTILLASLLALVACSKDEPAPRKTLPRELAKAPAPFRDAVDALAPADARVVVQFASGDRLTQAAGAMARAFGLPLPGDPFAELTGSVGVDAAQVRRDKPFAIAVSFDPGKPEPKPTFVLPFVEGAAALADDATTEDGYAAVTLQGPAGPGGSTLAGGLLAGDVSVRVDLAGIIDMYRDQIDSGIGMARRMMQSQLSAAANPASPLDPAKMMQGYFDAYAAVARKLVDCAETLDLASTRRDDGTLDLDVAFTAHQGSALDLAGRQRPDLGAMAARVPGDMPVVCLLRFDWSSYMKTMRSMFDAIADAMPEDRREAYRGLMEKSMSMMEGFGEEWGFGFDIGADGLRCVMVARAEDGQALIQRYFEYMQDPALAELGMKMEDLGTHDVGGVLAHRGRMSIDMEKYMASMGAAMEPGAPGVAQTKAAMAALLGKDGMEFELTAQGDEVLFVIGGGDDLLSAALSGTKAPAGLDPALARVGSDLNFALYVDVRGIAKGITDFARSMDEPAPTVAAGAPIPVSMACGSDGRVHRFGMSCNVESIAAFIRSLD